MVETIQKQMDVLYTEVERHIDLYYVQNNPEISDSEFDSLITELKNLEEKYPQYRRDNSPTERVNGIADENTFVKVTHEVPMLSLAKAMDIDEVNVWLAGKPEVDEFSIEPKLDGLACKLVYKKGVFVQAATRGDGVVGEDITATAMLIPNIPKTLAKDYDIEVRGEVFLPKSGLDSVNKVSTRQYKNVRNAASGILRSKTPVKEICQNLKFGAYMLVNFDQYGVPSHTEAMDLIQDLGFTTTNMLDENFCLSRVNNDATAKQIIDAYLEQIASIRDRLDFEIDGMVLKANSYSAQRKLGSKTNVPNWATAYKFPAMSAITVVEEVEWLLGNKGNITPRAKVKPVKIGGVTVTYITLHNIDEMGKLGVMIGDHVSIERRGDVIPKIVSVLKDLRTGCEQEIIVPHVCPVCNGTITYDGIFPRCDNTECGGRQVFRIENFVKALEIDNFGITAIEKAVEAGKISDVADIYDLKVEDLADLERMGKRSAQKIVTNIEKSKFAPLARVITGLTIKGIGDNSGKILAKRYGTLDNFMTAKYEELIELQDMGDISATNIVNWLADTNNQNVLIKLISREIGMTQEEETISDGKLTGLTFAFTGTLSIGRKEFIKLIENNGGIESSIKKGLNYLILGEGGKIEKVNKAKSHGATILSEQQFMDMIK